ncbi:MAG: nucleotidyltransferase domain-containing protein [Pseudomonadota bacterium]
MAALKSEIVEAVCSKIGLPHYRIFLFGSRANGTADARSDIDVGIESPEAIPLHVLNDIKVELDDIPLLQKIELVDFASVTQDFRNIALRDIEVLYEK